MPTVSELISQILLKKLREEELTPQESAALAEWEGRSPEHAAFIDMLMDEAALSDKIKSMLELDEQSAWQRIEKALEAEWNERSAPQTKRISWYKYAAAASVILVLGFGAYYLITRKTPVSEASNATKSATVADIAPGRNRAVLTLSDGSVIDLDSAKNGTVADEKGSKVVKTGDGKLMYESEGGNGLAAVAQHTLSTPRGGQFQLDLPDGSKVWLNAASSIRYPVSFAGERRVEITGEVYFEVAKDAKKKFIAVIKNSKGETRGEVEVLGTHFDVQAYDEENFVAASLLEGKIKMTVAGSESSSKTISPGQQARLSADNTIRVVNDEELENAVAWKNGVISFASVDVQTILRAVSRWYNVDVVYEGNIENISGIHGGASRNLSLVKLVEVLRYNDINCSLENGKLVVRPGKPVQKVNP